MRRDRVYRRWPAVLQVRLMQVLRLTPGSLLPLHHSKAVVVGSPPLHKLKLRVPTMTRFNTSSLMPFTMRTPNGLLPHEISSLSSVARRFRGRVSRVCLRGASNACGVCPIGKKRAGGRRR
mmetsp:Transcript_5992/g.11793  ORF Transcript_5992/g.11793 Transcript_5992/m.11793 type:complete len:121 (+) Transcript_5992:2721-3083(+)